MTISCSILAAALSVTTPGGETVCRVTPPSLPADAVIETTNLTGGVAWRIRYDGTAPRTVANEESSSTSGATSNAGP